MDAFESLWSQTQDAFSDLRLYERARRLALSSLLCLGRHTVTGWLVAGGRSFHDWSADYRLFSRASLDTRALFHPARRALLHALPPGAPLSVMLDDTLLRKSGRKIHGAQHFRDPLGPKFHTNLVWSQRFLQISAALPDPVTPGRARGVPLALRHGPLPKKPSKTASEDERIAYAKARDQARLGRAACDELHQLRRVLDQEGQTQRLLICSGDGGHTNRTLLRDLPERTTFIGRIRKDARLYAPPAPAVAGAKGRPASYGPLQGTPQAVRQDKVRPWQIVQAYAAGKTHDFKIKVVPAVRWRAAGPRDLTLIVVAPLGYRLKVGSPLLYREPAYLVCAQADQDVPRLLQNYLWRWQIEVNFREEKTTLGLGQAQVRTEQAARNVPALQAAAYATLLMALHTTGPTAKDVPLPAPKWRHPKPDDRVSTSQGLGWLRSELWGRAISLFSHFAPHTPRPTEAQEISSSLPQALAFASP
jgi:hypothetical protein